MSCVVPKSLYSSPEIHVTKVRIAGFVFRLSGINTILEYVGIALADHVLEASDLEADFNIRFRLHPAGSYSTSYSQPMVECLDLTKAKEISVAVPDDLSRWSPNGLYYRAFLPAISQSLAILGVVQLHAAALHDERTGAIALLGSRGAGKSTATASWLSMGGKVVTDDTLLFRSRQTGGSYTGLRRDLHLEPSVARRFTTLPDMIDAKEYMPGGHKIAYAWHRSMGGQVKESADHLDHVAWCSVSTGNASHIREIDRKSAIDIVWREVISAPYSEMLNVECKKQLIESISASRFWSVVWGRDIWELEGSHSEWLRNRLDLE